MDLIVYNGKCQIMEEHKTCEWLVIKGNHIFDMGFGNGYKDYESEKSFSINAKGGTVLPGLIDSHFHMVQTAVNSKCVDLSGVKCFDDIGALIQKEGEKNPEDEIHCIRLNTNQLKEGRFPNRYDIDRYWNSSPVWINNQDYQMSALNTYGVLYYKIPFNTVGVECNEKQMPTGIFKANANAKLRADILNAISDFYKENAIESIMDNLAKKGLTTINAVEGGYMYCDRDAEFMNGLINRKSLYLDMELFFQTLDINKIISMGLKRIGGCLYVDGTFGMRMAAISFDYADAPGKRGTLRFTQDALNRFVETCYQRNLQLALYTIGDRAIDMAILAHERAVNLTGNTSLRHRLEHVELPSLSHIKKAKALNLIFSVQPTYEHYWGGQGKMYEKRLGNAHQKTNPYREILDNGVIICGGSDSDVVPCEPMLSIHSAVNRSVCTHNISVYEAVQMFTSYGAYAIFKEKEKGFLKKGYLADLIVLDKDLFSIPKDQIKHVKVTHTIKSGHVVFGERQC